MEIAVNVSRICLEFRDPSTDLVAMIEGWLFVNISCTTRRYV